MNTKDQNLSYTFYGLGPDFITWFYSVDASLKHLVDYREELLSWYLLSYFKQKRYGYKRNKS